MAIHIKTVAKIILAIMLFLFYVDTSRGQELQEAINSGKLEYTRSCALCHGNNGKGDGVYASKLLVKPSDLSSLKKENNGVFPTRLIYQTIEGGDDIKEHGPKTMPIWGDRFDHESLLYVDPRFTRTFVRGRIFELLLYLEEIQVN